MQWLNENDDVSLEFLRNAYAKDKKDNVSISQGNEAQNSDYIIRLIILFQGKNYNATYFDASIFFSHNSFKRIPSMPTFRTQLLMCSHS